MKQKHFLKIALFALLFSLPLSIVAESITYKVIKEDDLGTIVNGFGKQPQYSHVYFENEFGDVTGNRYNQITKDKSAIFELYGWDGCTINNVTFNMCSNMKSGGAEVVVEVGDKTIFKQRAQFNDADWYGEWVGFQNNIYVDITKAMDSIYQVPANDIVTIRITGTESSVYINSYTIEYNPGTNITESPMGYVYEKIGKNGTIAENDNVIIYYAGVAAGDLIGGTNPYLSIYKVNNTANVFEPELMYFTMAKQDTHWIFINQYGDTLSATGEKKMALNEGVQTWDINFTFNGAEIANTNTSYGVIRYNTSTGDRFTTYTSTSMKLPYLYKRVRQNEPIKATSLDIPEEITIFMTQDTAVLRPKILPATATDQRVTWKSTNTEIATVRDGIIKPVKIGTTDIVVTTIDETLTDTCHLIVKDKADGLENVVIGGVYTHKGKIIVEQGALVDVTIFNSVGQLVGKKEQVTNATFDVQQGIYIVRIGNAAMPIMVR